MNSERSLALIFVGALLVLVAGWALAIGYLGVACPASGSHLACTALVRPSLRSLGAVPVTPFFAFGASLELLSALLLFRRGAKLPFARDAALLAALGAGFALGLQPLPLLVTGHACPVCLVAILLEVIFAGLAARLAVRAGARRGPILAAFSVALLGTLALSVTKGLAQRTVDQERRASLVRIVTSGSRLVLYEREGCPYCEALLLDVLLSPEGLARLERTLLTRREAAPGEPAPVLVALDRSGREVARQAGFSPELEAYLPVLEAALR